jgi:DNA-binding NtrC family response regulator
MQTLCGHAWPGNVRELQNLMEHLVVIAEPGSSIQPAELPFMGGDDQPPVVASVASFGGVVHDEPYHAARDRILAEFERRYLTALVNRAAGNMSKAARLAGVDRTTLYRLMEKHGLQRETIMTAPDGA